MKNCLFCMKNQRITADMNHGEDYCEGPRIMDKEMTLKIEAGRYLHIRYRDEDADVDEFLNLAINYCPLCGRKLHNPPERVTFKPEEVK